LDHFEASHEGPYGEILSSWKRTAKGVKYSITIPANSTANVEIPTNLGAKVFLNGKETTNIIDITAGKYEFEVR
jgi:alpha-L-rhamnosidase